jgi:uncharacterized linocin/CFP29 family protein
MVDILRKSLAPVTNEAWKAIENQAALTLRGNLSARSVVDFSGPHGWEFAAVNLGRVRIPAKQTKAGIGWGIREVLPLIEIRAPFTLDLMELDSVSRGAKNPELAAVEKAAERAAVFEENAVYHGFRDGGIEGIIKASPHRPLRLGERPDTYQPVVENAVVAIEKEGIGGPYDLVLETTPFQLLMAGDQRGYPLRRRIEEIIRGNIRWSPAIRGGLVISTRGGDYEFTIGQDFSIGYIDHDGKQVELYITESFTFRVIEPRAAIALQPKTK